MAVRKIDLKKLKLAVIDSRIEKLNTKWANNKLTKRQIGLRLMILGSKGHQMCDFWLRECGC